MKLQSVVPVLRVADLDRSFEFYCGRLGFTREFVHADAAGRPAYAGLLWDGVAIRMSSFDGGARSVLFFYVDDVNRLFEQLRGRGLFAGPASPEELERDPIHHRPTDQSWGMREICLNDPDGHILCFGTPITAYR